jgi:class 3 adenylate cyclase
MDNGELILAAILAIDIPELTQASPGGENPFAACEALVASAAAAHGGTLAKAVGDSFTITFSNCRDAVLCALDFRARLEESAFCPPGSRLAARMGIHVGEIRRFDRAILGEAVNIAEALQVAANPGSICLSGEVLALVRDPMGLTAAPVEGGRRMALPSSVAAWELSIPLRRDPEAARKAAAGEPRGAPSLDDIKKAILDEIRLQGRRLSVDEARRKFGWYGVEATEVIAALADQGILVGKSAANDASARSAEGAADGSRGSFGGQGGGERNEAPGYTSANAASDLGKSIESAIHAIVSEIERAVTEGKSASASGRHGKDYHINLSREDFRESAQSLKEVGREIKRQVSEARRSGFGGDNRSAGDAPSNESARREARRQRRQERRAARDGQGSPPPPERSALDKYGEELSKKASKLRKGLLGEIFSFILINPVLWFAASTYLPQFSFLAPLVTVSWAFGVLDAILSTARAGRQAREVDALPDLDQGQLKEIKEIHKARDSLGKHFIKTFTVPAMLALINLFTNPADLWFVLPSAIFAFTFLFHVIHYVTRIPARTSKFFAGLGIGRTRRGLAEAKARRAERTSSLDALGDYAEVYRDAQESAAAIERTLGSANVSDAAEIKPQMDGYLKQVLLLAKTASELDSIIGEIPMKDLGKDKAALNAKMATATAGMRLEYESSIREIEKQEESFKALNEQREVIDLRLRSSVNQLQQLKMELARARAADTEEDSSRAESALSAIRVRSEELSRYIDDLREGSLEALADPFLELERKYGAKAGDVKVDGAESGLAHQPEAAGKP